MANFEYTGTMSIINDFSCVMDMFRKSCYRLGYQPDGYQPCKKSPPQ
ncbi:MAG: hypothetical protein GX094_05180 [Clostridiales bacterium]|nr:hypothetical protein [Clostridiales bacterium]